MLTLLFGPLAINKPFFGPPGMAPERTAELRKAFADAMNDAELRAEVIKLTGEDLEPTTGRGRAEAARRHLRDAGGGRAQAAGYSVEVVV